MMARLLIRLVGADLAESILGDLEEQRARRAQRSRAGAALWARWALLAILVQAAWMELRGQARSIWGGGIATGGWLEVKSAWRGLRRAPGYGVATTAVLAISLTLAVLVFAVVDGVLLKPLPYPRSDELAAIQAGWTSRPSFAGAVSVSGSDVVAWRSVAPDVRFAAFSLGGAEQIDEGDRAVGADIGAGFLEVLEQRPILGGFAPEHFTTSQPIQPALLTYAAWQRRFGGDPSLVGRVLPGDSGRAIRVVGILPPSFLFPTSLGRFVPEVLTPLVERPNAADDRGRGLHVIARVPAGVDRRGFEARLQAATADVARRFPKRPNQPGPGPFDLVRATPFDTALRSSARLPFSIVFALAAALVLLACVNVTGLAAARAQDRRRELALRRALGAGGGQLIRLLVVENAILIAAGASIGVGVASVLLPFVAALLPPDIAVLKPLVIDVRVVAFAVAAAAVCVGVTAFWPARVTLAGQLRPVLTDGASTTPRRTGLGRRVLVSVQVALALAMAIGGALLVGSWARVWQQNTGYQVGSTVHVWMNARSATTFTDIDNLLNTVRSIPGVRTAGGGDIWLLQRAVRGNAFAEPAGVKVTGNVESFGVTTGFLETTGLAPVEGRSLTHAELMTGASVAVVSERVAREFWPGQPAVGRVLLRKARPYDVVGVVPDARYLSLDLEPDGAIYFPLSANEQPSLISLFVAFDRRPSDALKDITTAINTQHPVFRVRRAQPLTMTLSDSIKGRTFQALLFAVFGVAAVMIAGAGILGLAATLASRRTREVGVRMALGARPAGIARLMVRQHLAGAWAGVAIGAMLGAWLAYGVGAFLYRTGPFDPLAWGAALFVVTGTIALGALVPALRASRVDPVRALRVE
jgi:predicted permease